MITSIKFLFQMIIINITLENCCRGINPAGFNQHICTEANRQRFNLQKDGLHSVPETKEPL